MEIFKASNQWATRPADERFWSIKEMISTCMRYYESSVTSRVRYDSLKVAASDGDMLLVGSTGAEARLGHYAFGQLCGRARAPAGYLRTLPAKQVEACLNHSLIQNRGGDECALLLHNVETPLVRCATGTNYARIWNWEIGRMLLDLENDGWRVPPARPAVADSRARPATEDDVLGDKNGFLSIKVGDMISPAGVYASDADMFVFMIDDSHVVENPADPSKPLARGFFVWNSEVGDRSFGAMTFLYDHVCGNHIVWGAREVREIRLRHVGKARLAAFRHLRMDLIEYSESSVSDEAAKIAKAQSYVLGSTKEDVVSEAMQFVSKKKLRSINASVVSEAIGIAEKTPRYGNPRSPWAIMQGITEISQRKPYASQRLAMDRDASRLPEIAF